MLNDSEVLCLVVYGFFVVYYFSFLELLTLNSYPLPGEAPYLLPALNLSRGIMLFFWHTGICLSAALSLNILLQTGHYTLAKLFTRSTRLFLYD